MKQTTTSVAYSQQLVSAATLCAFLSVSTFGCFQSNGGATAESNRRDKSTISDERHPELESDKDVPSEPKLNSQEQGQSSTRENVHGALSRAVAKHDLTLTRTLVESGADVNENVGSEERPITPLLIAVAQGDEDIAKYLIGHGADAAVAYDGYTAADFARQVGSEEVSRILQLRESP